MRILVLSLLRLGDLLMQKPLLEDLRRRHPGATLDIVVNPGSLVAREVLDGIGEWIVFDRERLQKQTGTAELPLFAPVIEVENFIEGLSNRGYDKIYNFTHNRLSAFLSEGIKAPEKFGLLAEGRRFRTLDGRWARHFNERFGWRGATPFHYAELLAGALGLEAKPTSAQARGDRILLQPLTSDKKKNWSLENWKRLLNRLREEYPSSRLSVLGAPFEAEILQKHFDADDLKLGGLREVRELLNEAALVITGDTSIQHLAANDGIPILEIALGSAEPRLTGAFQNQALLLQGAVACAPCPPSSTCRKLSHECGEAVTVETVLLAAKAHLKATEFKAANGVSVFRTRTIAGEWVATAGDDVSAFLEVFEKQLWRTFLGGNPTESNSAGHLFLSLAAREGFDPSLALSALEREQLTLNGLFQSTLSTLRDAARLCVAGNFDPAAIQSLRRHLTGIAPAGARLRTHTLELSEAGQLAFAQPFAFFGHVRRATEDLGERLEIRQRWLILIREMGGRHERFARNVFERGPETP